MTFQHLHEMMANHPSLVERVQQVELTIPNAATSADSSAFANNAPVDRSVPLWGGWRSANNTRYDQCLARLNIKSDGSKLQGATQVAGTADRIYCASIITFNPWAIKRVAGVSGGFGSQGTGGTLSMGFTGGILPFYKGMVTGSTAQNLDQHQIRFSTLQQDANGDLEYGISMNSAPTGGNINWSMDFVELAGTDPSTKFSPFTAEDSSQFMKPAVNFVGSGDAVQGFLEPYCLIDRCWHLPLMQTSWGFQDNLTMLDISSVQQANNAGLYTVRRGAGNSNRVDRNMWRVMFQPWIIRRVQRGTTLISSDAATGNPVSIPLTGFTNFNKMAIAHHGSSSINPFSNLFSWTTAKLIDKDTAQVQSYSTFAAVSVTTSWEVVEFW